MQSRADLGRAALVGGLVLLLATACNKKPPDDATPAATASAPAPVAVAAPTPEPSAAASASAAPVATVAAVVTAPKVVANSADYAAVQRCCSSIAGQAGKAGPNQNRYKAAASVCSGIAAQIKAGKSNLGSARPVIRAQLVGVPVPGAC